MALFPLFRVSTPDKPQLRILNEKAPFKGNLRKAYENREGFPRYSRRTHAGFTPSPSNLLLFEPKISEKSQKSAILTQREANATPPKRRYEGRLSMMEPTYKIAGGSSPLLSPLVTFVSGP